ncbi:MAG: redoxin family protein [Phycisphaeraceae bacterium]|nr:redoxin family protein [Phycisphaeraceae bacterium]
MKKMFAIAALASLLLTAGASAQALKVGSKAPTLSANRWVKGEPVRRFEPGTVYLVEFWATWCGPCIKEIPHLTRLQKEYGDRLVVIGVAGSERKSAGGKDDRFEKLKTFVDGKGKDMDYRVVFDPGEGSYNHWMLASGRRGIPSSFLVDHEGKIAYIGHPASIDEPLAAVMKKAPIKKPDAKKDGTKDGAKDSKSDPKGDPKKDGSKDGAKDSKSDPKGDPKKDGSKDGSKDGAKDGKGA